MKVGDTNNEQWWQWPRPFGHWGMTPGCTKCAKNYCSTMICPPTAAHPTKHQHWCLPCHASTSAIPSSCIPRSLGQGTWICHVPGPAISYSSFRSTPSPSLGLAPGYPPLWLFHHGDNLTSPIFDIEESTGEVHFPPQPLHWCKKRYQHPPSHFSPIPPTFRLPWQCWDHPFLPHRMPIPSLTTSAMPSDDSYACSVHCNGTYFFKNYVNIIFWTYIIHIS